MANPTDTEWQEILTQSEEMVGAFQQIIARAAQALGYEFQAQRETAFRQAYAARSEHPEQHASVWSPLRFRVRVREGSVTLGWQLVYFHGPRERRMKKYEHIPTRKGGSDYDPFRLYQLAREHERELVVATERRAAAIRKAWAAVVAIRGAHRNLTTSRTTLMTARSSDPT